METWIKCIGNNHYQLGNMKFDWKFYWELIKETREIMEGESK